MTEAGIRREAVRRDTCRLLAGTSRTRVPKPRGETRDWDEDLGEDVDGEEAATVSRPAKDLLRFSAPHDARQPAAFIELRVLNPERVHWRRGFQAAQRYTKEHQDLCVPYGYRTPPNWSPPTSRWVCGSPTAAGTTTPTAPPSSRPSAWLVALRRSGHPATSPTAGPGGLYRHWRDAAPSPASRTGAGSAR